VRRLARPGRVRPARHSVPAGTDGPRAHVPGVTAWKDVPGGLDQHPGPDVTLPRRPQPGPASACQRRIPGSGRPPCGRAASGPARRPPGGFISRPGPAARAASPVTPGRASPRPRRAQPVNVTHPGGGLRTNSIAVGSRAASTPASCPGSGRQFRRLDAARRQASRREPAGQLQSRTRPPGLNDSDRGDISTPVRTGLPVSATARILGPRWSSSVRPSGARTVQPGGGPRSRSRWPRPARRSPLPIVAPRAVFDRGPRRAASTVARVGDHRIAPVGQRAAVPAWFSLPGGSPSRHPGRAARSPRRCRGRHRGRPGPGPCSMCSST